MKRLIKNIKEDFFTRIIEGLRLLVSLRAKKEYPKIRVCYLMNYLIILISNDVEKPFNCKLSHLSF